MTREHYKCEKCGLELPGFFGDCVDHVCKDGERVECNKSKGLGDTIAKVTKAFGVKPCGRCKKRQEALNKAFPYKK